MRKTVNKKFLTQLVHWQLHVHPTLDFPVTGFDAKLLAKPGEL